MDNKIKTAEDLNTVLTDLVFFLESTDSGKRIISAYKGEVWPWPDELEEEEKNIVLLLLKLRRYLDQHDHKKF